MISTKFAKLSDVGHFAVNIASDVFRRKLALRYVQVASVVSSSLRKKFIAASHQSGETVAAP
jgi:hypothetical protein